MRPGFFDPSQVLRAYRDPLSWAGLGVDLLPLIAVFAFGWGATPLVALYWLENLVIGVVAICRMIATGVSRGPEVFALPLIVPFFLFHYGLFCLGHGVFIRAFASDLGGAGPAGPDPFGLIGWALGSGPLMAWFISAIIAFNAVVFIREVHDRRVFRESSVMDEMFAPYGRIVTLHIAILLGAALTIGLGEPLLGVLLLILIRVVFGVVLTVLGRRRREAAAGAKK